jgi:hypothetical protein
MIAKSVIRIPMPSSGASPTPRLGGSALLRSTHPDDKEFSVSFDASQTLRELCDVHQ